MMVAELNFNLLISKSEFIPVTTLTLPTFFTTIYIFVYICDRVSIDQGSRISTVKSQTALDQTLLPINLHMLKKTENSQASSVGGATGGV